MPSIPVNTAAITTFGWSASFDIYNRRILFSIEDLSVLNAASVAGIAFSVVDSAGVELAGVDWNNPQIVPADEETYTLNLNTIPVNFFFQSYKLIGYIKDDDGNVYSTEPVIKKVCQPNGINESGYVKGDFQIIPDCINNVLTVKEFTTFVYNGLTPLSTSKVGTLFYPIGTVANVSFTGTPFSTNYVYTGQYRINCTTSATYDLGDEIYVIVTYITSEPFPITCSNFIGDITCCLTDVYNTYLKNCENPAGQAALQKYNSVLPSILNGLVKQINGQDASAEVALIKKQLNCNCGDTSVKQNEATPTNPAVYSIVLNGAGATTIGSPTVTGNTKTYNIASPSYIVSKGDTGDLAYTITQDTSVTNVVRYKITFNYAVMAGYILDAIEDSDSLLNQLNELITSGVGLTGLDGKCVINLTTANYSLSQLVTGSTLITNIVINGTNYAAPGSLFANNGTAVASWLNSLALGTFTAVVASGTLTIQSVSNINTLSTVTFTTPDIVKQFSSTNATLVQVLQAVIDYLCGLTSLQVALSSNLTLCTFDYNGAIVSTQYSGSQQGYNAGVASAICNIVTRINSITATTCASIKAIFIDRPSIVFDSDVDRIFGTLGGNCAGITDLQLSKLVIAAINKYSDVKTLFCAVDCAAPATCPDVSNISSGISGSNIGIYGLTWGTTPVATQTVSVRYRVNGTTSWTVATNALNVLPNGTLSGSSPYLITGLIAGTTYDIWVQNNCGGVGFIKQVTTPSGSVYSGSYYLENVIYDVCGATPVTLYSSEPFGTGVTMYTNIGLTTEVTGYTYITANGQNIFAINTSTGVVGADTGTACSNGTAGTYTLGNNTGTICTNTSGTLYTDGTFAVGKVLYTDQALTTPQTGYSYVVYLGTIYNVNSGTGAVGSPTGMLCSVATVQNNTADGGIQEVSGINGFTPTLVAFGTSQSGSHGAFTGTITVTFIDFATASSLLNLYRNGIQLESIAIPGGDGSTRIFASQTYQAYDTILITWT